MLWSIGMAPAHLALVLLVVVIWGLAFVATRLALDVFSPPELAALRLLIAAIPVVVLTRPPPRSTARARSRLRSPPRPGSPSAPRSISGWSPS